MIARRAAQDPKPVVFCPPLATFRKDKGAGEADLVEGYTFRSNATRTRKPRAQSSNRCSARSPSRCAPAASGRATARPTIRCICIGGSPSRQRARNNSPSSSARGRSPAIWSAPIPPPRRSVIRCDGRARGTARPSRGRARSSPRRRLRPRDRSRRRRLQALEPFAPAPVPADANGAAGPSADWDEHVGNILRGEQLHKSLTELAMKLVVSGMGGRAAGNHLRALMRQSQAPRDERWQNRFDYIPRAVGSARKKLADKAAEAARLAAEAAAQAQAAQAGASTAGNGAARPAPQPGRAEPELRRRRRAGYRAASSRDRDRSRNPLLRHSRRSSS